MEVFRLFLIMPCFTELSTMTVEDSKIS